jgi:hypothetical protein
MRVPRTVTTLIADAWYDRLLHGVLLAGGLIGALAAALVVAGVGWNLFRRTIGRRRENYRRLARLGTNAQLSFFESVLGQPPAIRRSVSQYVECVFVDRDYFVKVIVDNDESVRLFSVTTRASKFRPTFRSAPPGMAQPRLDVQLGVTRFADLGSPAAITANLGARRFAYNESYTFGNPGRYQEFIVGWNDAGVATVDRESFVRLFGDDGAGELQLWDYFDDEDTGTLTAEVAAFRSTSAPNTFTVIAPTGIGDLDAVAHSGPDQDHVRTLP